MSKQQLTPKRILVALTGIFLVCIGVAFNNNTRLGNDPVGIIYDGLRAAFHIPRVQLGMVSNVFNVVLIVLLFLIGRRYVNIGTVMYLVPYGLFISIGSHLYPYLFTNTALLTRIGAGVVGISLYYLGISLFVAADIGVDPFNGFMLTIRDKTGWSLRRSKMTFDGCLMVVGVLLGGQFGVITIVAALTTGPAIQALSGLFQRQLFIEGAQKDGI
ncbi:YczE/YyaS/YitT family protein [Furfurilactobacillus entadae]|uniref:YczE/YyaS/YitT family protein n=1 Tax=Furfurilactobacillus entadae TaxID=2922307 RepID=UPI0035E75531